MTGHKDSVLKTLFHP